MTKEEQRGEANNVKLFDEGKQDTHGFLHHQDWRIVFEKLRAEDDDRRERPVVLYQKQTTLEQRLLASKLWFAIFDF